MASLDDFRREPLLFGPSPIHPLRRLSEALGGQVEIWAKREDCNSGDRVRRQQGPQARVPRRRGLDTGATRSCRSVSSPTTLGRSPVSPASSGSAASPCRRAGSSATRTTTRSATSTTGWRVPPRFDGCRSRVRRGARRAGRVRPTTWRMTVRRGRSSQMTVSARSDTGPSHDDHADSCRRSTQESLIATSVTVRHELVGIDRLPVGEVMDRVEFDVGDAECIGDPSAASCDLPDPELPTTETRCHGTIMPKFECSPSRVPPSRADRGRVATFPDDERLSTPQRLVRSDRPGRPGHRRDVRARVEVQPGARRRRRHRGADRAPA